MSLEPQSIDIPLEGGINNALDAFISQPGQALICTNLRNTQKGPGAKRFGTSALATTVSNLASGITNIGTVRRLGVWNGNLVITDDQFLYTLSASTWAPATNKVSLPKIEHKGVALGVQAAITALDILYDATLDAFIVAWQMANTSGQPDIWSGVFDAQSGAIKWGVQRVTSTGDCQYPRLAKLTGYYTLTWIRTTGVVYVSARTSLLADWPAGTDITGGVAAIAPWSMDACAIEGATNELAVVYGKAAGATPMRAVKVTVTAGPVVTATASLNLIDGLAVTIQGIGIRAISGEYLWIAYGLLDGVPNGLMRALAVNHGAWTAAFATTNIIGATLNLNITRFAVERIDATHAFMVGCGNILGTLPQSALYAASVSSAAAIVSNAMPARVSLASRLTKRTDGTIIGWLTTVPESATSGELGSTLLCEFPYSTSATVFDSPRPIGAGPMRLVDTNATGYTRGTRVPNIETLTSNTKFATSVPVVRDLAGPSVAPQVLTADYADVRRNKGVSYGGAYYLNPMQMYDGERLSEVGFYQNPELNSVASGAGGNLSAGTYSVKLVYRWIDSRGRIIRSAPSLPISVTSALNDKLTILGQVLSLTDKQEDDTAVTTAQTRFVGIEVYRTEANGTIYYLDQTINNYKTTNAGAGQGQFSATSSQSDTAISANAALIEPLARNVAPPSLRCHVVWQNRLCGIGPDGRTIWISSAPADTDQPSWNEAYNVSVSDAGTLTALAVLDEKLIAFSERKMWLIAGQAPDINGNNGNLVPQVISSEVGASDERSVVAFSGGVIFRGPDTFYMLDRGLSLQPNGLMVQDYFATYPVVSSAVVEDYDREIRFSLLASESSSNGTTLVYHISQNEWSVRQHRNGAYGLGVGFASTAVASGVWYGCSSGTSEVLSESRASWLDSGSYVEGSVETPWIKMAGVQGFQRLTRIQVLVRPSASSKLKVDLYADYEASAYYTHTFSEAETASGRVVVHNPRQKTEAVKVVVTDTAPATLGTGLGIEVVALRCIVGVKKGLGKLLPAAQKA